MLTRFDAAECAGALAVDTDLTGGEVDVALCRLVDTAQVQHHSAVHQDPNVIVTGELKVHIVSVNIPVAVVTVGQALSGCVGKTELHIHTHTKPKVCLDLVGCAAVGVVTCVVHIMGHTGILSIIACIVVGLNGLTVGVGIGGVEGQEVGILTGVVIVCRVRGSCQIIVDVEPLVGLVVGCRIELCIVIIVAVVFAGGVCIDLEQVVALTQIMLTHDSLARLRVKEVIRSKQHLTQVGIVNAGIDPRTAGVFVGVIQIVQIGKGAAAIVVIEGEVQGRLVFIGNIAASHMRPGLTMAAVGYIHRDLRRKQIDQRAVVKHTGGYKVVGAYRVGNIGIVLTDIVGGRHPVGIQHRVFRYGDHRAGLVIVTGFDVHPTRQCVAVFLRTLPLAGKLRRHTGVDRILGILRATVAHDVAVRAVQPKGNGGGCLAEVEGGAFVLGVGYGKGGIRQLCVGILPCATKPHAAAVGIQRRFPLIRVKRTKGVGIPIGVHVLSGRYIAYIESRFIIVVICFFKAPVKEALIGHLRIDGAGCVDLNFHRIAVSVDGEAPTVFGGGINNEASALGQQIVGIIHRTADHGGRGRRRCRKHHHTVFRGTGAIADHRATHCRIGRLRHRIFHIALDHGQHTVFKGKEDRRGVHRSIAVFIQEDNVAGSRQIALQTAVASLLLPPKSHHLSAGVQQFIGEACISQTEGGEHVRPIAVGIAVPLAVTGNAVFAFTVFCKGIILFTLLRAQLGAGDEDQIFRHIARQLRQGRQPDLCGLHIHRGVRIACDLVDVFFLAAGIHRLVARLGVGIHRLCFRQRRKSGQLRCFRRLRGLCFCRLGFRRRLGSLCGSGGLGRLCCCGCRFRYLDRLCCGCRLRCGNCFAGSFLRKAAHAFQHDLRDTFLGVLMLFIAAAGAVCYGDARHAQVPHGNERNDQRQSRQNRHSPSPPSFFSIQL